MKQVTLLFFILLAACTVQAQQNQFLPDTSYLVRDRVPAEWTGPEDTIFWEVLVQRFSNGRELSERNPVGDTTTTNSYFTNRSIDVDRQLAQAAQIVMQRPAVNRSIRVSDKALVNAGIGSVYAGIDSLFWREILDPKANNFLQAYTATVLGADYAATMRRVANTGKIRLSFNSQNYNVVIYSDRRIQVENFPSQGLNIDLFRTGAKRWESISGNNQGNRIIPALVLRKQ